MTGRESKAVSGKAAADAPFVLMIHPSRTDAGGIVNATLFHALALKTAGVDVEIWTASAGLERKAAAFGITVMRRASCKSGRRGIYDLALIARALRLRRRASAVIHQGARFWAFGRLFLRGVPEYVVFHNRSIGGRRRFANWLTISRRHQQDLQDYASEAGLKRRIAIIPNGPLGDASELKADRPATASVTFGTASNFAAKKAVPVLLEAFQRLVANGHDVRLVLAGDGFERLRCEALARDLGIDGRITWLGWVSDTRAFYRSIDVFCLASTDEPFGLVVVEAMQAGLPVIATATYGPSDIVEPGQTGWIVEAGHVAPLAAAMEHALDESLRTKFGRNARQAYEQRYTPEAAGERMAALIGIGRNAGQPS